MKTHHEIAKRLAAAAVVAVVAGAAPAAAQSEDEIVARCEQQMGDFGWVAVKRCADRGIEAAAGGYYDVHLDIVARCTDQYGGVFDEAELTWAAINYCIEDDTAAWKALQSYGSGQ